MSPNENYDPNHDRASIERRLDAVERALSEDEPIERADRLDDLESRVVELEAAVQALRGYVGSVRAINEDVESRADRAYRKARAVERAVAPAGRLGEPDDVETSGSANADVDAHADVDPDAGDARRDDAGIDGALARFRHRL